MKFYLGIHMPNWLRETDVPLFVSRRRLVGYRNLPRAKGEWALDSGAFTEISSHGRWTVSPQRYVLEARRYMAEIGNMEWAAIQDWMCEPFIIKKTGLSVKIHQVYTVRSLIVLRSLAPEVPWAPVLQGWHPDDYQRHREMYERVGFNLKKEKVVGVGSVCRRGHTEEIHTIAKRNSDLQLHGFGVKTKGVEVASQYFRSTDSMAWSFDARYTDPLPGHKHRNCANCLGYALWWRERLLQRLDDAELERLYSHERQVAAGRRAVGLARPRRDGPPLEARDPQVAHHDLSRVGTPIVARGERGGLAS